MRIKQAIGGSWAFSQYFLTFQMLPPTAMKHDNKRHMIVSKTFWQNLKHKIGQKGGSEPLTCKSMLV